MTSGQEMQRVSSYNLGARMGHIIAECCIVYDHCMHSAYRRCNHRTSLSFFSQLTLLFILHIMTKRHNYITVARS